MEESKLITKHNLTHREKQSVIKNNDNTTPEYKEGKIKLNFEHKFSTGEIFKAREDDEGNVTIFLERNSEVIFNFQDLFKGYFFTPTSAKNKKIRGVEDKKTMDLLKEGDWGCIPELGIVRVGAMNEPKDILTLLHEIGHTFQVWEARKSQNLENSLRNFLPISFLQKEIELKLIKNLSKMERNAWAYAIKQARKIHKDYGVNIFEIFKNRNDFEDMIYGCLISYRVSNYHDLNEKQNNLGIFSWKPTEEDIESLKDLFDKERLQRGVVAENELQKTL